MMKKYFTYILLVVVSLFVFGNVVSATDDDLEENLGKSRGCSKVNTSYISSIDENDLNCLYKKTIDKEPSRCIIVQLAFDKDGKLKKSVSNVEAWKFDNEGIIFSANFNDITDESLQKVKSGKVKSCPNIYFEKSYISDSGSTMYNYLFHFKSKPSFCIGSCSYEKMAKVSLEEASGEEKKIVQDDDEYEKLSCEERLGGKDGELIETIQSIVNIIKVFIPILLIVLGTLDFGKAIFSFDEGNMKKAQTKFMKRIVIAIGFFLVPTFLGFILRTAHSIWPVISDSFCGIDL